MDFLPLWFHLFWTLCINRILQGVVVCVWILSLNVFVRLHVVAGVSASSLGQKNRSSGRSHSVCSLISGWTFGLFCLRDCYERCCSEHLCTSFWVIPPCVSPSWCLGVKLPGPGATLRNGRDASLRPTLPRADPSLTGVEFGQKPFLHCLT